MRLFVIGDYSYKDPTVSNCVYNTLDWLKYEYGTEYIVTFNEHGVDRIATQWAYDNKIKYNAYQAEKSAFPLNVKANHPNWFLRKLVDDYKVDAFLFFFLENKINGVEEDKSIHRKSIRWFYTRTKKCFKQQIVFSTHENPPN